MNLKRVKHTLLRMSLEEKVIGIGAILILIGSFMPWYSVNLGHLGHEIGEVVSNAFSGDLGVIGFVVILMTLIAFLHLMAENLHLRLPQFGYKKSQILFFLMGQSFFLVLLALAIYTKRSIEFTQTTQAGLRFGIYLSLLGSFLGAFAAFAKVQSIKKRGHSNPPIEEDFAKEGDFLPPQEPEAAQNQPMYFGEDKTGPVISPAFQASPSSSPSEPHIEEEKNQAPASPEKNHSSPPLNQSRFFNKEAGLK